MDLAEVQAAVRAIHPYYPNYLNWLQDGDVVKAFPKSYMSQAAFDQVKALFKKLGGRYAMHNGEPYFELVLRAEQNGFKHVSTSLHLLSQGTADIPSVSPVLQPVLLRLQAQLDQLRNAGAALLNVTEET